MNRSDLKSKVKTNLVELCSITKVNLEMLNDMKAVDLVADSEYETVKNFLDNNKKSEAATYLYVTILPRLNEDQERKLFQALEKGGNFKAIYLLNPGYKSEENNTASNISAVAGVSEPKYGMNQVQAALKKTKDYPEEDTTPRRTSESYKHGKRFGLICNVTNDRIGSEDDETELARLLKKDDFEVTILDSQDRTEKNILKCVDKFIDKVVFHGSDRVGGIFVAIMSHGTDKTEFLTEDDKLVPVKTIIDKFHHSSCRYLTDIPKVIFLNMCRGDEVEPEWQTGGEHQTQLDWGEFVRNNFKPAQRKTDNEDGYNVSTDEFGDDEKTWTNLCFLLPAIEGCVAYRKTLGRAWFVEDFCKVLEERIKHGVPTDIEVIYEETRKLVEKRRTPFVCNTQGKKGKQTPQFKPIRFDKLFLIPAPKQ